MKTYKQLADELGVSKDKVKYRARNIPSEYLVKNGDVIYITDEGIAIISGLLRVKSSENEMGSTHNIAQENQVNSQLERYVSFLESEIEVKNRQLEAKSQQITELTNAINTAQQNMSVALHVNAAKHLPGSEPKPGFFSRFFPKSNDNVT